MASYNHVEVQSGTVTTANTVFTFDGGIQGLVITATADVLINFETPAGTADNAGFLVKGGITNSQLDFHGGNIKQLNARAVSGSASVYLIGVRH